MVSVYPELDAKSMLRPILRNYNLHVLRFISLLEESLTCRLVYEGPSDWHDHIRDKTVYACSVSVSPLSATPTSTVVAEDSADARDTHPKTEKQKKKIKILKGVFPVMIGSNLDHCVRKMKLKVVSKKDLSSVDFLDEIDVREEENLADIAASFFVVNGCVRQLPYFFTNDPTNAHVVRGRRLVRCYTYDADDRGKEMSYFAERSEGAERGDIEVVLNDGTVLRNREENFFDHCPHRTEQGAYMDKLYREGPFDIDHLANKVIVSPGHLFVKLFVKYLYRPLKIRDWPAIQSKHAMVVRSIESGKLLHVLSKKTVYFKDPPSTMTLVHPTTNHFNNSSSTNPSFNPRATGGDVYVEKNTGCYREVSMQTYPLNPYLSYWITRQISSKVTPSNTVAFHPSYVGFLCIVGTFETKNIGRTGMMVRNTLVSTRDDVENVYAYLQLEVEDAPSTKKKFYVVVNEACVPVSASCFERTLDSLETLKYRFETIECYREGRFVFVRYKIGLFFKRLVAVLKEDRRSNEKTPQGFGLWVTARDEGFWKRSTLKKIGSGVKKTGSTLKKTGSEAKFLRWRPLAYHRVTSYLTDLNPFFHHNVFTKNILAFNTLKSAVLAVHPRYSEYFMETLSAYARRTPRHRRVCRPADAFSSRFALWVPRLTVAYASFRGLNQEDCIVVRRDVRAFDCRRFHTVRLKWDPPVRRVTFHPTRGDPDPECSLVGHLVCHDPTVEFRVTPQTLHTRVEPLFSSSCGTSDAAAPSAARHYRVCFNKSEFRVRSHTLSDSRLAVCLERFHESRTGDKLSSFHGQKGVVRTVDALPVMGRVEDPRGNVSTQSIDMLLNACCLFRMTTGQIREAQFFGGRDCDVLWNSDGKRVTTGNRYGIFVGPTFYFPVSYFAVEHSYAPAHCIIDMTLGQPVRGRSRNGGMKIGNMEISNGMRGNGLSACFEEKALEHSDRIFYRVRGEKRKNTEREEYTIPLTKSTLLCRHDVLCYKCDVRFHTKPYFVENKKIKTK